MGGCLRHPNRPNPRAPTGWQQAPVDTGRPCQYTVTVGWPVCRLDRQTQGPTKTHPHSTAGLRGYCSTPLNPSPIANSGAITHPSLTRPRSAHFEWVSQRQVAYCVLVGSHGAHTNLSRVPRSFHSPRRSFRDAARRPDGKSNDHRCNRRVNSSVNPPDVTASTAF